MINIEIIPDIKPCAILHPKEKRLAEPSFKTKYSKHKYPTGIKIENITVKNIIFSVLFFVTTLTVIYGITIDKNLTMNVAGA